MVECNGEMAIITGIEAGLNNATDALQSLDQCYAPADFNFPVQLYSDL